MLLKTPSKINLFLAIHGPRLDGFHELSSLVCQLDLFDEMELEWNENGGCCEITCNLKEVPCNSDNLIHKAWALFCQASKIECGLSCRLIKKIPPQSGLGAGSSNAMNLLTWLNERCGNPLNQESLLSIGAQIGSDVPLFINQEAKIVRGRGEQLESLQQSTLNSLSGLKLVLFRPEYGISTPWAFRYFKKKPENFLTREKAGDLLRKFEEPLFSIGDILYNTLEIAVFSKYIPMKLLIEHLRKNENIPTLMSGSGSTAFSIYKTEFELETILKNIHKYYGPNCWIETCVSI